MDYADKDKKIPNKWVSDEDLEFLLSIKPDEFTRDLLYEMFAITEGQVAPRFLAEDVFVIEKSKVPTWNKTIHNMKEDNVQTTVGSYFFNVFVTEQFNGFIDYWNKNMTGDDFLKYEKPMPDIILSEKVEVVPHYANWANNLCFLDHLAEIMIPSDTYEMLEATPVIKKFIKETKEKYKEELLKNPASAGAKIEREVVGFAKKEFSKLDTCRIYEVGDPTFGNDLKNMALMNGPAYNQSNKQWEISFSSFSGGISKEELALFADIATTSGFLRSVGTGVGGDYTKQLCAAAGHMVLDDSYDSDCGSTDYTKVTLTEQNRNIYAYRYMKTNDGVVELTPELIDENIGKEVELRYMSGCLRGDNELCMVCAGGAERRKGVKNIGLTAASATSAILRVLLKAMHNNVVKLTTVVPHIYAERVK